MVLNWDYIRIMGPIVIVVVWLILAITGWYGDRARGRRRCSKCWHSMDNLPRGEDGWTCPECGTLATSEKRMLRPRRYWIRIGFCAFTLFAALVGLYARMVVVRWEDEGALALVPSTMLVFFYPENIEDVCEVDTSGYSGLTPVARALGDRELWWWQRALIDAPDVPIADQSFDEFVQLPDRWIAGEPIPIRLKHLDRRNWMCEEWIYIEGEGVAIGQQSYGVLHRGGPRPEKWRTRPTGSVYRSSPYDLPAQRGHTARVQLRVEHALLATGLYEDQSCSETWVQEIEIPLVQTFDEAINGDVLTPYSDPSIDAMLEATALVFVRSSHEVGTHVSGPWYPDQWWHDSPFRKRHAVSLVYETQVVDGDEVLYSMITREHMRAEDFGPEDDSEVVRRILAHDQDACRAALDRLVVRVVPRPDLAIYEMEHDRYWVPSRGMPYLEIPLGQAHEAGKHEDNWLDLFSQDADDERARIFPVNP